MKSDRSCPPSTLVFSCLLRAGMAALLGLTPLSAESPRPTAKKEGKDKELVRFVCVSSPVEDQEVIVASRGEKDAWQEHGRIELRSALISEWIPAQAGELHLTVPADAGLRSICRFKFPSGAKRAVVILLPAPDGKGYQADVLDPAKQNFVKGSALVVNYSKRMATVFMGSRRTDLNPGTRKVVKARPEANGMYRMLAAYTGEDKKLVPCYDRYVPANEDARDMVFLLPDPTLGLKVFSLSEFGPFE